MTLLILNKDIMIIIQFVLCMFHGVCIPVFTHIALGTP